MVESQADENASRGVELQANPLPSAMPTTFSSGLLKVVHEEGTLRTLIGELMPRDERRLDFCPMTQNHQVVVPP